MSPVAPLLRIPVGVIVERRKATSPWADVIWRPVAVLGGNAAATEERHVAPEGVEPTIARHAVFPRSARSLVRKLVK